MRVSLHGKGRNLADLLRKAGHPLDMRCGGHGTCGRCRVRLIAGECQLRGEAIKAPAELLACRAVLLTEQADVELEERFMAPDTSCAVLDSWQNLHPMPALQELVIGIDIGTTTLAASALCNGRIVARETRLNPQVRFGDNVISRISAAGSHLAELRQVLLETLAEMLQSMPRPARVAIAGNSTMSCLFHGVDPSPMGHAPFALPRRSFMPISAECLGLPANVPLYTMPMISAFLGGDVLGGIRETNLAPGDLFIDIGTNCEMVFCTQAEDLVGTAAAAGPAFEGAGISCGMRAIPGAICHYRGAGDFDMIHGEKPQGSPMGLCGSAMVDFLAVLHRAGHLSRFGRYVPSATTWEVAPGIDLTERDIEQLLKAKGAVSAGISCLEEHCGMKCRRLVLAGGFAQFLTLPNAVSIGMLPDKPALIVGNTSLASAVRLAAEPDHIPSSQAITQVHLNDIPGFGLRFMQGMML